MHGAQFAAINFCYRLVETVIEFAEVEAGEQVGHAPIVAEITGRRASGQHSHALRGNEKNKEIKAYAIILLFYISPKFLGFYPLGDRYGSSKSCYLFPIGNAIRLYNSWAGISNG